MYVKRRPVDRFDAELMDDMELLLRTWWERHGGLFVFIRDIAEMANELGVLRSAARNLPSLAHLMIRWGEYDTPLAWVLYSSMGRRGRRYWLRAADDLSDEIPGQISRPPREVRYADEMQELYAEWYRRHGTAEITIGDVIVMIQGPIKAHLERSSCEMGRRQKVGRLIADVPPDGYVVVRRATTYGTLVRLLRPTETDQSDGR